MKTSTSIHSNIRTFEQSNIYHSHRGSALLIVLGMLSFMVVSAVGFSIYMRQGRLPSSYLRRNVASRYLVKAALANAIEELDGGFMTKYDIGEESSNNPEQGRFFGIHDDPYPGIVNDNDGDRNEAKTGARDYPYVNGKGSYKVSYCKNGDFWSHRVFCPFGLLPHPNDSQSQERPPLTVPTLTLEALAYLPPAIIDDVRKVSRLTRTAQWRTLPYDAGRFAYTVVNVSDLFDVNRLRADVPRNSGPDRIALGSLCADDPERPMAINAQNVTTLENILAEIDSDRDSAKGGISKPPFTSLADFNLVAQGVSASGYAPFMDYIGKSAAKLVNESNVQTANSLFVTDTWFPVTVTNTYDLAVDQPFVTYDASGFPKVVDKLNKAKHGDQKDSIGDVFKANLGLGNILLYDYLDSDNVPISLALPTTEAVPMIVGVQAPEGFKLEFDNIQGEETGSFKVKGYYMEKGADGSMTKVPADVTIKRTCQRRGFVSFGGQNVFVKCLATYPFKRMVTTKRKKGFKVRAIMKVWFAPEGLQTSRPNGDRLYPYKNDVVSGGGVKPTVGNGVVTFMSDEFITGKTFSGFSSDVEETDDALDTFTINFKELDVAMPVYWKVHEEIQQTMPEKTLCADEGTQYKSDYLSLAGMNNNDLCPNALRPLNALCEGDASDWSKEIEGSKFDINGAYDPDPKRTAVTEMTGAPGPYRLYSAVWVQVLNEKGKVVDMVPACQKDDDDWLEVADTLGNQGALLLGDGTPILNFMNTVNWSYDKAEDALKDSVEFQWRALYAVDPRFNYAPEDWFMPNSNALVSPDEWKRILGLGTTSQLLGQDGRDRDIFMFVSDQEYLQSLGELQFLVDTREFDGNASSILERDWQKNMECGLLSLPITNRKETDLGNKASLEDKFVHGDKFWRTYSAYRNSSAYGTDGINPFKLKQVGAGLDGLDANIVSGIGGFKLNPFSEDSRVINAAIIGTPFDYYVASTNDNQQQVGGYKNDLIADLTYDTMVKSYSFGENKLAKIDDKLIDIVDAIRDSLTGRTTFDMDAAWGDLLWQKYDDASQINDYNKIFLANDISLSEPLHGVDRKFLYSFWRECFDNRQQLFLIFVRAEPTAIGGGATGSLTSAQLGGRAVALVWRDPTVPTNGSRTPRTSINNRDEFRDFKRDNAPHRTRVLFYHQFD